MPAPEGDRHWSSCIPERIPWATPTTSVARTCADKLAAGHEVRHDDRVGEHDEFFEEDEPLEDVLAAFSRGEKGFTARPVPSSTAHPAGDSGVASRGWTKTLPVPTVLKVVSDLTTIAVRRPAH